MRQKTILEYVDSLTYLLAALHDKYYSTSSMIPRTKTTAISLTV